MFIFQQETSDVVALFWRILNKQLGDKVKFTPKGITADGSGAQSDGAARGLNGGIPMPADVYVT